MKIVVVARVSKLLRTGKKFGAVVTGRRFRGPDDRASEFAPVCDLNQGSELVVWFGTAEAGIGVVMMISRGQVSGKQDPDKTAEGEMRCSSKRV
jgi:hypothetical protein